MDWLARLAFISCLLSSVLGNWDHWWTYDGISGPAYWGLINPAWTMCNKGRRQSPVNIDPAALTFDPSLTPIQVDKHMVSGKITNTGQSLVFRVEEGQEPVNLTGGPLAYKYQFQEMFFHWGQKGGDGSEHTVAHHAFPAELQLYGFNSQLYTNLSVAREFPGGVVGVSIMLQVRGETPLTNHDHRHSGLGLVASKLAQVKYRGESARLHQLSLASVLPNTGDYITYEGSTTFPGCWETATWVVMNKPVYLSRQELDMFYQLRQGNKQMEKAPLGNNLRPRQPLNNRALRTNIAPQTNTASPECDAATLPRVEYEGNSWVREQQASKSLASLQNF